MIDEHDSEQGYCRKLGHVLHFGYCRIAERGNPCSGILNCWFETFAVQEFIGAHYSKEEIESMLAPPPPKISALMEIVEKARKSRE